MLHLDLNKKASGHLRPHSYPMQFHVEATGVAHWLSLCVPPPQGGGGGVAVGAGQAHPSGG